MWGNQSFPVRKYSLINFCCCKFQLLGSPVDTMRIVLEKYYDDPKLLTEPNKTLRAEGFSKSNKVSATISVIWMEKISA